ncbi:MAG: nitrogen regulation protein NR(I) [Methylococcales bacterium]|jgi:two-component system, NtrC family, nitrogen regulation response regulator GlnG|nr:nitrogen regulation protein NR(I) [Methylococcales bacterium]MBT7410370.1 nitrogen regulation protein NR(I) [Methylococcales bacterium]
MINQHKVWIIDDDRSIRWVLEKALHKAGFNVISFSDANNVIESLNSLDKPDSIITDIRMPGVDGLELLNKIKQNYPDIPVVIMTAHSDLDSAVSAFHGGAFEYLPKPFDLNDAIDIVKRACEYSQRQQNDNKETQVVTKLPEIIGEAPAMQEVFRAIGRLARSHITVLINGDSGTGKELVAKALYNHSPRSKNPFIALNMAAIPKDLLESELFGYEKGAFTGAQNKRSGYFEKANHGTLFLDEIGDMPIELQTRLLRVLSYGEFYNVGGHTPVKVDVRIIAATHQNLEDLVKAGKFREDLYHRLNVIKIQIPRLKNRKQDIPILMKHFLKNIAEELAVESKILLPETEKYLSQLDWPGNVRQLENTCRWITVMASGQSVHIEDLPTELSEQQSHSVDNEFNHSTQQSITNFENANWEELLKQCVTDQLNKGESNILSTLEPKFETIMIESALNFTGGKKQESAKLLGWGRNTLTRKIKELGLNY